MDPVQDKNEEIRYETSDASARALARFMLFIVLATIAVAWVVRVMYFSLAHREAMEQPPAPIMQFEANRVPPNPRLQASEPIDLTAFRSEEERIVTTYGWVDKSQGIVRIPVDEAMRLLLERGLPVAKPSPEEGK